jgi:hypothetical protein
MITTQSEIEENDNHAINDAIDILMDKLNKAIDDIEEGRVISEEEMWEELNKTV